MISRWQQISISIWEAVGKKRLDEGLKLTLSRSLSVSGHVCGLKKKRKKKVTE